MDSSKKEAGLKLSASILLLLIIIFSDIFCIFEFIRIIIILLSYNLSFEKMLSIVAKSNYGIFLVIVIFLNIILLRISIKGIKIAKTTLQSKKNL